MYPEMIQFYELQNDPSSFMVLYMFESVLNYKLTTYKYYKNHAAWDESLSFHGGSVTLSFLW